MKALQYFGKQDLRFSDLPMPTLGENDILMKIKKVGICGTDLHIYNAGMNVPLPLVMGHEFVGEIVEIGSNVKTVKVGARAVGEHVIGCGKCDYCIEEKRNLCKYPVVIGIHSQGALAEYLRLPAGLVHELPQELSDDQGVLVEPLSIAVYAAKKADIRNGDSVGVIGQGPIGLLVDFVAKSQGGVVFGFDKHARRLAYAKDNNFVHKGFNITEPEFLQRIKAERKDGLDIIFEAVGSNTSAELSLALTRPAGKVIILGVFDHDVMINMMDIVRKELVVMGSWTSNGTFQESIDLMMAEKLDAGQLITHRYAFSDAIKAFEEAATDKENRIKSVIEFD